MRWWSTFVTRAQAQDGFTIIEVLTAVLVLGVGLAAAFQLLIVSSHQTKTNRLRQAESSLARELTDDSRSLPYTQLNSSGIATALQPNVANSTVTGTSPSGSTLSVQRSTTPSSGASYTFTATITACSLDDPSDGYGDHSSSPSSGGSWCPDALSGAQDPTPDDYKRVSVTITPSGKTTPAVQQAVLVYNRVTHGPAVTCLSTSATTCPGANQTLTTGTSLKFYVTTSTPAAAIQWLVNGSPPGSSQLPSGSDDPYTPGGTNNSTFTWNFPPTPSGSTYSTIDGTYTISAVAFDDNGSSGTRSSLQVTLNLHPGAPPTSVTAGWNNRINGVDVQWVPSIDQDIKSYNVYRWSGSGSAVKVCSAVNGVSCYDQTATSPGTEPTTCTNTSTRTGWFTGQSFTTPSYYYVTAVDKTSSEGPASSSPGIDGNRCDHPPNAPTSLTGTSSSGQVALSWTAPSTSDPDSGDTIQAWRVYRWPASAGTAFPGPGSRYELVGALASGSPVTSVTDQSPDPGGVRQNYCVTSLDDNLNESPCSGVVSG